MQMFPGFGSMSGPGEPGPGIARRSLTSWASAGYQQQINMRFQTGWLIPFILMALILLTPTEAAFGWFQQRQVECPADKELERLVRSSFQQFELHLYQRCADSLSTDSKMLMEASLSNDAEGVSFGDLKADPGRTGLESVLKEVEKLNFIRSLHLPVDMFASFSTKVLQRYRQRANSESAWEMRQHPWTIRYGLYAVFLYGRQREIIDGLIELFIQIVHRLSARS